MDPVTIVTTTAALLELSFELINRVLKTIHAIKGFPAELLQTANDVEDFRFILVGVEETIEQGQALLSPHDLSPVYRVGQATVTAHIGNAIPEARMLLERANAKLSQIDAIVQKYQRMLDWSSVSSILDRVNVFERNKLKRLREELKDIKSNLAAHFSIRSSSYAFRSAVVTDHLAAEVSRANDEAHNMRLAIEDVQQRFSQVCNRSTPEEHRVTTTENFTLETLTENAPESTIPVWKLDISRYMKNTCQAFCSCSCHRRFRRRNSSLSNKILGSLMIGYSSLPFIGPGCDDLKCIQRSRFSATFTYYFPTRYVNHMFSLVLMTTALGDIGAVLKIRKIQYWDFSIFRFVERNKWRNIKALLDRRAAHPSASWYGGWTPLHYAISYGHATVCRLLLSKNADPMIEDGSDQQYVQAPKSPNLMSALEYAWTKILGKAYAPAIQSEFEELFANRQCLEEFGFTVIHKVVLGLHGLGLELALSSNPQFIDEVDFDGRTPLFWAAFRGDLDKVTCLLSHGANPNIKNRAGTSPLKVTVSGRSPRCIVPLLSAGAEVDSGDCQNQTPLFEACDKHSDLQYIKPLVEAGANVNAMTKYDQCPLIVASSQDHVDVANYLIQQGAEINVIGQDGRTPLLFAVEYNSHQVLESLLDHGADCTINSQSRGPTLAHFAARHADVQTLEILAEKIHGDFNVEDILAEDFEGLTIEKLINSRNETDPMPGLFEAFERLLEIMTPPADQWEDALETHNVDAVMPQEGCLL